MERVGREAEWGPGRTGGAAGTRPMEGVWPLTAPLQGGHIQGAELGVCVWGGYLLGEAPLTPPSRRMGSDRKGGLAGIVG